LDAVAVARQMKPPRLGVPEREGGHAVDAAHQRLDAPAAITPEQDLGVRARAEDAALLQELGAQLAEIVDLAIVRDHRTAIGRAHGLIRRAREIDHREPPMGESEAAVEELAGRIRPAMDKRLLHRAQMLHFNRAAVAPELAGYPAHQRRPSLRAPSAPPRPGRSRPRSCCYGAAAPLY